MSKQSKLNFILDNEHIGFLWATLADKLWIMENVNFPTDRCLILLRQERIKLLSDLMDLLKEKEDE